MMSGVELSLNNADYKAGLHCSEMKDSIRNILNRDIARRDLGIWIKKIQKDQRPRLFRILKDIVMYYIYILFAAANVLVKGKNEWLLLTRRLL